MASYIHIQNRTRPLPDPARILVCDSFLCRLRGLMFRSHLPASEGLLLSVGRDSRMDSSIHMLFVPFDLAVFWIDSSLCVVDRIVARSWRPAYFPARAARHTLEMHPDRLHDYEVGDQLEFVRD